MNKVTNTISKILSTTPSDMAIYVAGDKELMRDIKNGWPNRNVFLVSEDVSDINQRGLLITKHDRFVTKF